MLEGKDQGHNVLTQVFSKKKVFLKLPRGLWCVFQDEEKKGHDFGPFFTNQKIVLSSTANRAFSRACRLGGQGQRTLLSKPRTLRCVLEDVVEDSPSEK